MITKLQKQGMRRALKELTREELELFCYVESIKAAIYLEHITGIPAAQVDGVLLEIDDFQLSDKDVNDIQRVGAQVQKSVKTFVRSHN